MDGDESVATVLPEIAEPVVERRIESSTADSAGDWLCAFCLNRVANDRDRFQFGGQDEFTFTNPQGIRFEIITFLQTLACRETGTPTLAFTWFPGHAWSFCHCAECGQHLGWFYSGQHTFAGLIRARMLRAVYLRN